MFDTCDDSELGRRDGSILATMAYCALRAVEVQRTDHSDLATPLQPQAMARHRSFDTTLGSFHEVGRIDHPAEDFINVSKGK